MPYKRKRNPNEFTTDEAQTATLIYTEGSFICHRETVRGKRYAYPAIDIRICAREGLEPAQRVFKTAITRARTRQPVCPPELFPPDGKGSWAIRITGKSAERVMERLQPLIPLYYIRKWQENIQKCKA